MLSQAKFVLVHRTAGRDSADATLLDDVWTANVRIVMTIGSMVECVACSANLVSHLMAQAGAISYRWIPMLLAHRYIYLWPLFWCANAGLARSSI